jgi:hypothetical protein
MAHNPSRSLFQVEARWNVGEEFERAMIANALISPAVQAIWPFGATHPFTAVAFFGDEFRNSLWRKNVLRPIRCRDVAIAPLTSSADGFSALMIARQAKLGPFRPADVELIRSLLLHFRRAATVSRLLNFKSLAEHCRDDAAPDPISTGIIMTDAVGKDARRMRSALYRRPTFCPAQQERC